MADEMDAEDFNSAKGSPAGDTASQEDRYINEILKGVSESETQ